MKTIRLIVLCLMTACFAAGCAPKLSQSQLVEYTEYILLQEVDDFIRNNPDFISSPSTNIYIAAGYDEAKHMYLPPSKEALEIIRSRGVVCSSISEATFSDEWADGLILFSMIYWSKTDKCYEGMSGRARGLPGSELNWLSGSKWRIRREKKTWVVKSAGSWIS